MQSSFKKNLIIGFSLSLFLLLASAIASYVSISNLLVNARMVNKTNEVLATLENVLANLRDAETGQRGFLLTGDESFLEPYLRSKSQTTDALLRVNEMISDNPDQLSDATRLGTVVQMRLASLAARIDEKRRGNIHKDGLYIGKKYMDEARAVINRMKNRENMILENRTKRMNDFAASTPILIIIASVLSILVTVVSFYRATSDFSGRLKLQKELEKKDEEVRRRITIIDGIAKEISKGNYTARINDEGSDVLGSLGVSLNKMANSLDKSFTELSKNEWLQQGLSRLNAALLGEKSVNDIAETILNEFVSYTNSQAGTFYAATDASNLQLLAGYSIDNDSVPATLEVGEALAGQAALKSEILHLDNIEENSFAISYTMGKIKPKSIVAIPLSNNRNIKAVIEIAALHDHTENELLYLKEAAKIAGINFNLAQNRSRVHLLLSETQAQAEELQAQHSELENINSELEAQSQKLQASEEELKVQQEELIQANQEMEERSRLLEEKNQMIVERNLEIQRKADEIEQSTRYKSEFLANMSHELRTPLNSVLLLSKLLSENLDKNLSDEQVEYAKVIQSSGQGLLTLIDEILDLSKIEAGKMEVELMPTSIAEIRNDLRSLFDPIAKDKQLKFSVKIEDNLPSTIITDKLRLEQILKNLLSNAMKFTKRGEVSLSISAKDNVVSFAVKDTGIGIEPSKQHQIFQAFQQADGSTRRKFGGTGLGLSISRQLAHLLGGDITVTSVPDEGSVFTLSLPMDAKLPVITPKASEVIIPEKKLSAFVAPVIPENIPDDRDIINEKDKSILIIEDDIVFAKALLDYTRNNNYKGIVAVRGDEGVQLAQRFRPSGILLDLQLPVKDGWQVMEELKSNPATKHIPVHMMSSQHVKKESLMKGAVDFIDKPVALQQMKEIFDKIETVLKKEHKKVLIVEENSKHAKALAYFLENFDVNASISTNMDQGVKSLRDDDVDCVIMDMGVPGSASYNVLEEVKKQPGMENIPVIIFTGKSLSKTEEKKIKQYADSIVIKTAHSFQRILDEVSLFLHLMEESAKPEESVTRRRFGTLTEVLANKKILVVDDDVRNIFSLSKVLELYSMQVLSAVDGKDGLKQLEENNDVSVVLMDIMMPEMDGYEAIKAIRKNPRHKNLPVIAITAKAMTGDREKCIQAGASDYISKPVDVDQLLSLLRVWLYDSSE